MRKLCFATSPQGILYWSIMCLPNNGYFTPWLQPGEQRQLKTKGLQPLKGLNAKAEKDAGKANRRAKAPVKKIVNALSCDLKREICR